MASSVVVFVIELVLVLFVASFCRSLALGFGDVCPNIDFPSVHEFGSKCPRWIDLSPPLKVDGEKFEQKLTTCGSSYKSVLFYAPWCPFSTRMYSNFAVLSSMFPQIEHLTVEESSIMPSVLSRYGIHSFPAVLLSNYTTTIRYHGPKDLNSLVHFYKKVTGFNPIADLVIDQSIYSENKKSFRLQIRSLRELINEEPYLALGMLFICLKALIWSAPILYCYVNILWVSHVQHMYLGILPGTSQLLQRVLHVFDIKRMWSKLRLCNSARDFRKGANNAKVWATSFASVSLGESSSSRLSHLD